MVYSLKEMNGKQLKQLTASIFVILSLFASSVAACCCSHHTEKAEAEIPSCHQTTHEEKNVNIENADFIETSCVCFSQSAPKIFAKSEHFKVKKIAVKPELPTVFKAVKFTIVTAFEKFVFAKPFYLSDSFRNQKSPRAPPTL